MRFLNTYVGICLFLILAVSCDRSDPLLDDQLIGSWSWIDRTDYEGVLDTIVYYETPATSGCGERLDLSDKGKYFWTYENCVDPEDQEGDESGKWHVNSEKNKIYFTEGTGDKGSADYAFNGDTLVLTKNYVDDDVQYWTIEKWKLK
jgi:hypothetical protein